jgi:hypothetical protein
MEVRTLVEVGDILTSVTIFVSVIALVVTWRKDRLNREAEQADRVRSAAAIALTKLDRWRSLRLTTYEELDPLLVETGQTFEKEMNVGQARDFLWKAIHSRYSDASTRIVEEQVETAYFALLSHFPASRERMVAAFERLSNEEDAARTGLLMKTRDVVLSLHASKTDYEPSTLADELRKITDKCREEYVRNSAAIIGPVQNYLFGIIARTDRDILTASRSLETH